MEISKVDEFIDEHQSEKGPLISILHDIQRQEGYLPRAVISHLSERLRIPVSEIFRVISYFEQSFSLEPQKKHRVKVCTGTACYLKHADEVQNEIREELGDDGEPSDFHLDEVRCMGCCDAAPVVEVNGQIMDKDSAKNAIIKLKGEK